MVKDPSIEMATPAVHLVDNSLAAFVESKRGGSSSGTTVVFDKKENALYFSKALIPYNRHELSPERIVYRHIGLYGYRKSTLQRLSSLPEGVFEKSEKLEQLRALEMGYLFVSSKWIIVDVPTGLSIGPKISLLLNLLYRKKGS